MLATPADVAQAHGLSIPRLRWLAFHTDAAEVVHYVRFTVPKKSGGVRELSAPHRDLAAAQRWIFQNILQRLPDAPGGARFRQGPIDSNRMHAPHVGRHTLVNADLKDFFPTITFHRVRGALEQLGYSPAAATIFALLVHRVAAGGRSNTPGEAFPRRHRAPRASAGRLHEPCAVEPHRPPARFAPRRHRRQTRLAIHALRR